MTFAHTAASYTSLRAEAEIIGQEMKRIKQITDFRAQSEAALALATAMRRWQQQFCALTVPLERDTRESA